MVEKWIIPAKDSWLAKRVNFTEKQVKYNP
jgi:hypothetical protein